MTTNRCGERGTALVLVLIFVILIAGSVAVLAITSRTEMMTAANLRFGREALYAAEGALGLAIRDLGALPDWDAVLTGAVTGTFTDGASIGTRRLPGGESVVLCCGPASLTASVQSRADGGRSWGADTPQWTIFSWTAVGQWLPAGALNAPLYVVVWVADDPEDGDGNPAADNNDMLQLHAQALGPTGGRRVVEALVQRPTIGDPPAAAPGVRIVRWREVRW